MIPSNRYLILAILFALLSIMMLLLWLRSTADVRSEEAAFEALAIHVESLAAQTSAERPIISVPESESADDESADSAPESDEAEPLNRFALLQQENPDFAAWLYIDGTGISYPVMWTPDNPEYYLHRDFNGEVSKSGTPFISKDCSVDSPNVIVYGHNMKGGTMFNHLLEYRSKKYWDDHREILFDTCAEERHYIIIAAFYSRAFGKSEKNVFRYYNYVGDLTQEQREKFVSGVVKNRLYDTGYEFDAEDEFLTLSTCAYYHSNGRFVVVAKRVD